MPRPIAVDLVQASDIEDQIQAQLRTETKVTNRDWRSFQTTLPHRKNLTSSTQTELKKRKLDSARALSRSSTGASSFPHANRPRSQSGGLIRNGHPHSHIANENAWALVDHKLSHKSQKTINHEAPVKVKPSAYAIRSPRRRSSNSTSVNVEISPPSQKLQREINAAKLVTPRSLSTGLSQVYSPINSFAERAVARRSNIALTVNRMEQIHTSNKRQNASKQLVDRLQRKLDHLNGPRISLAPLAEKDANDVAKLFRKFKFINEYRLGHEVKPVEDYILGGCHCDGICYTDECICLESEEEGGTRIVPYQRCTENARLVVVNPQFLEEQQQTEMITECGAKCGCGKRCWNRVVQRGRTVEFEIFHTGDKGLGLRSPNHIYRGQFIDCYLGEVITKEKADKREEISSRHGHSYLFSLDFYPEVKKRETYVVDGERYGGITRFINHSCNPNCRVLSVSSTPGDKKLYNLAFFALKDILPNTELTLDYNPRMAGIEKKNIDPDAVACLCGENNCRGQLWPNWRKETQ